MLNEEIRLQLDRMRMPHPEQRRIDAECAHLLNITSGLRHPQGFVSRRGESSLPGGLVRSRKPAPTQGG
jgi:hypothetical protein